MSKLKDFVTLATIPTVAAASVVLFAESGKTTNTLKISCEPRNSVQTVIATFSNQERSQVTPILSFLPKYFDPDEAASTCQHTATKLETFYSQDKMNYLASDTVEQKPVVCAVERRGSNCNSYNSEILFSLVEPVSPTQLLYDMLGNNFKGSQPPSSRTISRIYTDLRPFWWPL